MPHPRTELSLTRHLQITIEELWREGKRVSEIRNATLYGRADVTVLAFTERDLSVEPAPIKENPNHANVSNWPIEKSAQKMKAIEIALSSQYIPKSNETN